VAGRQLRLACGPRSCALLCEAIEGYAAAAFPPGGSECAQASRESLLTLAAGWRAQQAAAGAITLRSRQRPLLRAAVTTYFEQLSGLPPDAAGPRRDRLLALLQGEAIDDAGWDGAA
jgi:hypothetical protein